MIIDVSFRLLNIKYSEAISSSSLFLSLTGKYFWRLTREKHLVSLRPAQIHRFWRGLPPNLDSVDAVYERPGDHKIVFFKGTNLRCHISIF